jgi:hypothetical protein
VITHQQHLPGFATEGYSLERSVLEDHTGQVTNRTLSETGPLTPLLISLLLLFLPTLLPQRILIWSFGPPDPTFWCRNGSGWCRPLLQQGLHPTQRTKNSLPQLL